MSKRVSSAPAAAAAPASSTPAAAASNAETQPRFSPDAAERELAELKAEAKQLQRDAAHKRDTVNSRMRAAEVQEAIEILASRLRVHRAQQSAVGVMSLGVFLLLALLWILMEWESPLAWMEAINKHNRHEEFMRNLQQQE